MLHLVLGGARSGKSRYSESIARSLESAGRRVFYIATADTSQNDLEMAQRIKQHQQMRPSHWQLIETKTALSQTLESLNHADAIVLVDCLTLWLSNCLLHQDKELWHREKQQLLSCLSSFEGQLLMVSNEVGQGLVPMDKLARVFVDESGWLHQDLARICDQVTFVTAGIPQQLKPQSNK